MLGMALQAVGFDIDGTLYPDRRAHLRSLPFFLAHPRAVLAFSRTRRLMRELGDDDEASELRIFAVELNCGAETARRIRDTVIYNGWEGAFRGMRTYPGVKEALLKLQGAGLSLAALSDFPVGRKLEYFGLDGLFDVVLGFPESRRLKPNPEPFRLMAERLGVPPQDMLYVGNKLDYDVRGAENAGMRGALIGPERRHAPDDVVGYPDYRRLAQGILSEVTI